MEATAQISLKIDGQEVLAPEGTTILEAAQAAGIRIPTLCHHPALSGWGGCRLCVVEVDGAPKLAASCVMPVRQGMAVVTRNDRIFETRRTILQFLLAERNHYCMFCAQSGVCELQQLAYEHQIDHLGVPHLGDDFAVDTTHPDLVFDHNRCVLCGRCVRACRELSGAAVLDFHNRGGQALVGVDLSGPWGASNCASCGVCSQFCPTGAIFTRHRTHYAVFGKLKDWRPVESVCPECGLLCRTVNYVKANNLLKVEGSPSTEGADRGQLCRRGRFDPLKTKGERALKPLAKDPAGQWTEVSYEAALAQAGQALVEAKAKSGKAGLAGFISSACSSEELSAFKEIVAGLLGAGAVAALDAGRHQTLAAAGLDGQVKESPWSAIGQADLLLVAGLEPQVHPVIAALTRRASLESKAQVVVLGPDNSLGPWAAHLPVAGESLVEALKALAAGKGGPDPGLPALLKVAARPLLVLGTALGDPRALKEAAKLAGRLKPWRDGRHPVVVLKPAGNSAAAWSLGLAGAKEGGPVKAALVCLGEEATGPGLDLPQADFLAVVSPYLSPALLKRAHLILPKPTWLEAAGTYASADGQTTRRTARILEPPPGVRPTEEVLAGLAAQLGPAKPKTKEKRG